ncbi:MAG: hypothetical protein ABIH41_05605 [Nanoarchaeota archaeon]
MRTFRILLGSSMNVGPLNISIAFTGWISEDIWSLALIRLTTMTEEDSISHAYPVYFNRKHPIIHLEGVPFEVTVTEEYLTLTQVSPEK